MMHWLLETFIATSILMLVVLALRGPVAQRFGARAAYLLWLAPALRMLMPPLPDSVAALPVTNVQHAATIFVGAPSPASAAMAPADAGLSMLMIVATLWLGGAAIFLLYHLVSYRRFVQQLDRNGAPLAARGAVRISASPLVTSPLAYGIFGRTIVIPQDFKARFDATEQRLAIIHELTHHRRGDLIANAAALIMLALHWFNPIAHFAHRAFRLDQEAACDAIVLRKARPDDRHAYGTALLKAAMGPVPLAACAMSTASMLKSRLKRIAGRSPQRNMVRAGSVAVPMLVLAGVVLTASNSVAAPEAPVNAITPRMIVIGGGILSASDTANDRTDESTRGKADARPETIASQVKSAVDEAFAEAETALKEAESAMSEADAARSEAQSARAAAEQARSAADRASRRADVAAPPAPPAPPLPPGAAEAPEPPAPPQPAAVAEVIKVKCQKGEERRVITTRQSRAGGKPDATTMVLCLPTKRGIQATIREALTSARASIASEAALDKRARDEALAALDREIRDLDR